MLSNFVDYSPMASASDGNRGLLLVISGPSGVGKTTITRSLERCMGGTFSVSATTRPRAEGEVAGRDYYFLSDIEFQQMADDGAFLEHAQVYGEYRYGTPREPVERALSSGQNVVMEIDVQGGIQVARRMPASVRIFVMPPDRESLRARLEGRKTEAKEQLQRRLAKADGEIATARDSGAYQHFVVNDVLDDTVEEVKTIIQRSASEDDRSTSA